MDLQVLIATMNQKDHSLLEKMNIHSSAIVGNQCEKNSVDEFEHKAFPVRFLSYREKGVGLNRNNTLMRASAEICLLSDDDVRLNDDYCDVILDSSQRHPAADVILFSLREEDGAGFVLKKKMNINFFNFMRFGAVQIAFRLREITKSGISFNLHFGGGAEYGSGEDTIFLHDCLKKGLRIIALPEFIGQIQEIRPSTWFVGYNDKFFTDKGALFSAISKKWASLLCLQFALRKRNLFKEKKDWFEAYQLMREGSRKYRNK